MNMMCFIFIDLWLKETDPILITFICGLGGKIDKRPVTFGNARTAATMMCVCHSPIDDLCFTGSDTGEVYVWQATTLRRTVKAHKGAVTSMYSLVQYKEEVSDFTESGRKWRSLWPDVLCTGSAYIELVQ